MKDTVYLDSFTSPDDYLITSKVIIPLESLISYNIYKFCNPSGIHVKFIYKQKENNDHLPVFILTDKNIDILAAETVPWQVLSCNLPVIQNEDTVISGLCGVARHVCKERSTEKLSQEHEEGLLGFRKGCLQAPNEVSIWTKFCEVDIIRTVKNVIETNEIDQIPTDLIRFENHLNKPLKVHNVYKVARELKKVDVDIKDQNTKQTPSTKRAPKGRKWKSNIKKTVEVDSKIKIEDLDIKHVFAEGPFFTLADLILLTSYNLIIQRIGNAYFESNLPLTYQWYRNITSIENVKLILNIIPHIGSKLLNITNATWPIIDDVSLYKCDPKRHNPKKRLFTKEIDIENALSVLTDGMELRITNKDFESGIKWSDLPDGANPFAGHLPDNRALRKSQQLENLALAVLNIAKDGDVIVDFCSGSGHLGILLAYLLPKCTVILLENKEQSILRARNRVHGMNLKNVFFFQCNLDFYVGKFDIGVALHACGVASDLVLDKCLNVNAKFVLCPCCYGFVHVTDRIVYPRSTTFSHMNVDQYMCIGHAADQTHKDHHLSERGAKCMAIIDSDRAKLAEEFWYKVSLSRLKPLSCTPKNNLLIGVPC